MNKTVVLTGGGTAGHVTPNLAIIPKLKEMGFNIEYIGTKDGMEHGMISETGIPYHIISAGKFRRYFSLKNFTDPFRIIKGLSEAGKILKSIKPSAVFSKGGFVSVPVVLAAHRQGIPVVLHESDYTPGLANRISIPRATKICVAFSSTLKHVPKDKGVYTGLPIREELLKGSREKGLELCGFSGKKPVMLIMGGSLGAKSLNDALDAVMPKLLEKYDVIHIRGKQNLLTTMQPMGYRQFEYINKELPDIYAASDIMVSRAGATAVFEILALALPALLIPLPKASSRGDQILNANYFSEHAFSYVLDQETMTEETLLEWITKLDNDKEKLRENMKKEAAADAAANVAKIIADVQNK
jgi:UDP-N-acetylglucosamine--N-acetylmuramyl-(pentapeptide) pyrophosphoryl-undecaprenol N-acetylglucosamine transferase